MHRDTIKQINVKSSLKNIRHVVDEVIGMLNSLKADESDIFDIRLSMEEALINAMKYGNKFDERLDVSVEFGCKENKFILSIEDRGGGFDYKNMPDPTNEENLLKGRGRGVFLILRLMDSVEFNKKGNRITMIKYLKTKNKAL